MREREGFNKIQYEASKTVPHTISKLANDYNLFHLDYLALQRVAIFATAQCTTYSFIELQQYSPKWLQDFFV